MKITSLICICSLLFLVGCPMEESPELDLKTYIKNNSEYIIIFRYKNTVSENDTVLWEHFPWGKISLWSINPGEVHIGNRVSGDLKRTLENYHIHYYFFYADTLSAYPWNEIRDEYKVAKRVTISSWEEYEAMEFTIEFP